MWLGIDVGGPRKGFDAAYISADGRLFDLRRRLEVIDVVQLINDYHVNDISMWSNTMLSGPDYERIVLDQFEVLLEDSSKTGRVMALPLHTFIVGQPFRFKYLARVLREICRNDAVWVTTSDDIAAHYISTVVQKTGV